MIGIYGSNGFIGKHLVRRLATLGLPVRAISRRHDEHFVSGIHGQVEFLTANFGDPLAMAASLQDIDTVVQLISTSSPGLKNEHAVADIQENVIPHITFLRSCVQAGVRRYVFLSSGGTIYGPDASTPTPESAATNPICSHGLTKLSVEKYIQMHAHVDGLEYVILRLANPYGPGQEFRKGQGLIPAILDRYNKGLPVRILGDGRARRDYVYIDDVIDAIAMVLELQSVPRLVLNIGGGTTRSVLDVLAAVEAATGHVIAREYVDARGSDVEVSSLDIALAHSVLGWSPHTGFEEGVHRTVAEGKA